jgi:hypothetical protein
VLAQSRYYPPQRPSPHLSLSPVAAGLKRLVSPLSSLAIECEAVKRLSVPLPRSDPVLGLQGGISIILQNATQQV